MTQAQSPFIPGTKIQYAWDSTSLGYLKTCPRLYQYTMIDGWSSSEESIHLRFGIEFHQALQEYEILKAEAGGISSGHREAMRETIRQLLHRLYTSPYNADESTKAGKYKSPDQLVMAVINYLDDHADEAIETHILPDGRPAVELSFRFELEWGPEWERAEWIDELGYEATVTSTPQPYILSGHLDRVVNFAGELFVLDHKTTTTTLSEYYFNQFEPSNQMTLYTLASQVILGATVQGVIISGTQLLIGNSRTVRGFTYRTPDQLTEWMEDLRYWLSLAETYATADHWPMNDTACDKFGGCRFREVCSKSPQVREKFLAARFTKLPEEERWNPLRSR